MRIAQGDCYNWLTARKNNAAPIAKKSTTTYYCAGCKGWYCFTKRVTTSNVNSRGDNLELVHAKVKGEREVFFDTCFAKKHKGAWQKEDTKVSAMITPEKK